MRLAAALIVAGLVGCSNGPTAPATPPPPQYLNARGGWAGSFQVSWSVAGRASGSYTCNMTWVVDRQTGGSFEGSHQLSGEDEACASFGRITGDLQFDGSMATTLTGVTPACTQVSGDRAFFGFMTANTVTAQRRVVWRCAVSAGTFDFAYAQTITLNRR